MHATSLIACLAIVFACTCRSSANAANILALFPFPGKSHSIMLNKILNELLDRGHELDVINCFPLKRSNHPNLTSIEIAPHFNFWGAVKEKIDLPGIFEMHDMTYEDTVQMIYTIGTSTTEYALNHTNVQKFIHNPSPKRYDVILVEQFFQEPFLLLAHQLGAPVISVSTFGFASYFNEMFGSFGAWAHVPHEWMILPEQMTFWQRVMNVQRHLLDRYNRQTRYMVVQQKIADRYFAHLNGHQPTLFELTHRLSAILMNSHAPLTAVRPLVPGLVDVGGLHIEDPRPLPADIQKFIDEAEHGVIFFSLGTQVQSSEMPVAQLNAFIRTLSKLKQRILWKFESDSLGSDVIPKNLLIKKWMPQNDILAHPNVKVFITHGGLLGTQEGVWYGVPMLGIPFYTDQHLNTRNAHNDGYAIALQFNNVTDTSLTWALNELLYNSKYAEKAKLVSRIFRDRPERAIDLATYWIEYVIRFGGTQHLRSAGKDLSWASYFLLDIGAALLGALLLSVLVLRFALKRLLAAEEKCAQSNDSKKKTF